MAQHAHTSAMEQQGGAAGAGGGGGLSIRSGHSSEQGARPTMEDEVIVKECFPIPGRGCFSFFGVFDGHGGRAAAIFAREHLFRHLHAALSAGLEPAAALTQAYLETDNAFIAAVRGDDASAVVMTAAAAVIASPALSLPPAAALPSRRQQSANLAVRIPAASLPPVTTSVASARSASAMPLGVSAVPVLPALGKDTSGTTAVCALVEHQSFTLYIGNCGDSRAVLSTTSGAIIPLTNDHKADRADEMERIRRAGGFVVHKRVMGELAISRALGDSDFKEPGFRFVLAHPELAVQRLSQHDDFVLLACDGVFDVLSNEQACAFVRDQLSKGASFDAAAKAIVKHAIENLNTRDNVTVVLIKLPPVEELQAAGLARPEAPQLAAGTCGQAHLLDSHQTTPLPPLAAASPAPVPTASPFTPGPATTSPVLQPSAPAVTAVSSPFQQQTQPQQQAQSQQPHQQHQLQPLHPPVTPTGASLAATVPFASPVPASPAPLLQSFSHPPPPHPSPASAHSHQSHQLQLQQPQPQQATSLYGHHRGGDGSAFSSASSASSASSGFSTAVPLAAPVPALSPLPPSSSPSCSSSGTGGGGGVSRSGSQINFHDDELESAMEDEQPTQQQTQAQGEQNQQQQSQDMQSAQLQKQHAHGQNHDHAQQPQQELSDHRRKETPSAPLHDDPAVLAAKFAQTAPAAL